MADELSVDRLLASLAEGGVAFIVVGGFSVVAHGYVRATKDLVRMKEAAGREEDRLDLQRLREARS